MLVHVTENMSDQQQESSVGAAVNAPVASWPNGTYQVNYTSFDEFASENFVKGTPLYFTKKEVKKPLLVYTPDREKDVRKLSFWLFFYLTVMATDHRSLCPSACHVYVCRVDAGCHQGVARHHAAHGRSRRLQEELRAVCRPQKSPARQ